MLEKIKEFFGFLGRAWRGGRRGKIGILCAAFAAFMALQLFIGDVSIQHFVIKTFQLNRDQKQLAAEKIKLARVNHHIELLQNHSPDFLEETSLKYLNIGDPKYRILKD